MSRDHTPEFGRDRFIIWSMSYDWEPEGDPNGHAVRFEHINPYDEFDTLEEAQAALAKMSVWDEQWASPPEPGARVVFWVWRETAVAAREIVVEAGDAPRRLRDQWGYKLKPPDMIDDAVTSNAAGPGDLAEPSE